ncbi:MAG: hypothetical protein J6B93_04375 [Clostridia bacterium]|nr:hypothetical protein [Clostridia bacterium]
MRKLLAVLLAAVMLVTSLSCLTLMTVSADSAATVTPYTPDTFATANTDNALVNFSDNLLAGDAEWVVGTWPTNIYTASSITSVTASMLYDGDFSQLYECYNWYKPSTAASCENSYITFSINASYATVDKIFLAGAENSKLLDFKVYLGMDKDTLYSETNLVATYNAADADLDKYVYTIGLSEAVKAKYIGFKFTDTRGLKDYTQPTNYDQYAAAISAVGAYGTLPYTVDAYTKDEFTTANAGNAIENLSGNNLLTGNPEYKICGVVNGAYGSIVSDAQPGQISSAWLYNGAMQQVWQRSEWAKPYTSHSADKSYITFNISGNFIAIDKIFLAGTVDSTLADFEIYLGTDKDTLYNAENMVATYSGPEGTDKYVYWVELDEGKEAKYLGIRVPTLRSVHNMIDPYNTYSLELTGVGAYGSTACTITENLVNSSGVIEYPLAVPLNYHLKPYYTRHTGWNSTDGHLDGWSVNGTDKLTDGQYAISGQAVLWDTTVGGNTFKIAYDLKHQFNITDVLISSGSANAEYANKWNVYISNDKDTLFNAENLYCAVDLTHLGTTVGGYVTNTKFPSAVKGQYVGIHLLETSGDKTFNANEIAIFGEDDWTSEYQGYLPNVPGNNILNGIETFKVSSANSHGDTNYVTKAPTDSDNGYTTFGTKLTDNATTAVVTQWNMNCNRVTKGGVYPFDVAFATGRYVFDIGEGKTATAGSVLVQGNGSQYGYKYLAFVSNDESIATTPENLFKSENLFAICDDVTYGSAMAFVDENHYKTGRFFGVMIYDALSGENTTRITEIGFYAPESVTVQNTETVPENSLTAGKNFYKGTDRTAGTSVTTSAAAGNISAINDGVMNTNTKKVEYSATWWNAKGSNFYFDLGNVAKINKIVLSTADFQRGGPLMSYAVYISDTAADLFNVENQIAFVWNKNNDVAQEITFDSITGQYVGVYVLGTTNDTSSSLAPLYLSEFAVYGKIDPENYDYIDPATDEDLSSLGNNLLDEVTTEATIENADLLTNNVIKSTFNNQKVNVAAGTKLTYDIGMALDIENIVVSTVAPATYKVYLGNDAATLFATPAIDYYADDTVQLFKLTGPVNAQYVGFEFTADATVIELGAYAKVDISEFTGDKEIANIYVDGNKVDFVDANVYKNNSAIQVVYAGGDNDVILVKGTALTKNEALANAFDFQGAQVRTNAPGGLRFVNTISANALALASKVGTLSAKFADLNGADLTNIDTTDYVIANAVVFDADTAIWMNGVEGTFSITINNIKDYLAATYYAARPYAVVTVDEVEYTIYGEEVKNSPAEIAQIARDDENANLSPEARSYLDTMVQNANVMNVATTGAAALGISEAQLEASIVNADADYSRLAKVIEKAKSGQPIKLTALGGSVTHGAYSGGNQAVTCYANRFREYLANTFGVEVTLVNAGISATNSDVGLARFDTNVPADTDLLVVDFAVNDYPRGREDNETVQTVDTSYEAIIRKALDKDMAVMLLFNVYNNGGTATNDQIVKTRIGNHYKLPMVSVLDAVWDGTAYREEIDGNPQTVLSNDNIHPNAYGHKLLASLLSYTMANAIAFGDATAESYMPADYFYADTAAKVNTVLYTTENLPEEWVVSMGDYYAEGSQYNEKLPNAWRIDNTGTQPMVLNIPNATYVTLIIYRPHLSYDNEVVNAQAPIHTLTVNGTAQQIYGAQTDSFAVALNNFCSTTATDCEVTLSTAFKDGGVETARIIGFAVAQAE